MPARAPLTIEDFTPWLRTGERGLSSLAIVEFLTGFPIRDPRNQGRFDHPLDPSDFRRCRQLLAAVPAARLNLREMRAASPTWARLVDAWDELDALYVEESTRPDRCAPRLYKRMQELLYGEVA